MSDPVPAPQPLDSLDPGADPATPVHHQPPELTLAPAFILLPGAEGAGVCDPNGDCT